MVVWGRDNSGAIDFIEFCQLMRALNPNQETIEETTLLDAVCELVDCHDAIPIIAKRLTDTRGEVISAKVI